MARKSFSLSELSDEAGIPARTVRFYISRGLLPGPEGAGRGARYGKAHLERLLEILRQQREGLTLAEIALRGGAPGAQALLPEPEAWWVYRLADGVEVRVRGDRAPWHMRRIRRALAELATRLEEPEDGEDQED